MRKFQVLVGALVSVAGALAGAALTGGSWTPRVRASDHGDAPAARNAPQLDLNDLYVFVSPEDPARTIVVITACPLAGFTGSASFATKSTYNLLIDTGGDSVEDDVHSFSFGTPAADGKQSVSVAYKGRGRKFKSKGTTGAAFSLSNGTRAWCGMFDDPEFCDALAIRKGNVFVQGSTRNFYAGLNTLAIVLDIANGEFGPNQGLRVWATTAVGRKPVDRIGRPFVGSLLVPAPKRDAYNAGRPKDDTKNFAQDLVQRLVTLRGANYTGVAELVQELLPDVLVYTPGSTLGLADGNGRKLDDDAYDLMITRFTNSLITTDFVGNDTAFRTVFPYLADPNP